MIRFTLALTACLALGAATASAQKKPIAKKPIPKTTAQKPTGPTVMMPGDNGKVGAIYRLGPKDDELYFTIEKAEFATRFFTKDGVKLAPPGQRLLVLTYAVQNPQKRDMALGYSAFKFTVVSPSDENQEFNDYIYHPDKRDQVNLALKPAQKVRAVAAIPIHGVGPVNKVIVQRLGATPVLRYDLKGKVAPLKNPFAAADGLDSTDPGVATLGAPFELGAFDVTVEKLEEVTSALGNYRLEEGQKLVVATVSIKNSDYVPHPMHYSILTPKLTDENGEDLEWTFGMLKMSTDEDFNMSLEPGQQVRTRLVFRSAAKIKPVQLKIKEQASERSVTVPLAKP